MSFKYTPEGFANNTMAAVQNKLVRPEMPSNITYIGGSPANAASLRGSEASPDPIRAQLSQEIDNGAGYGDLVNNKKHRVALDYAKRFMNQFTTSPFSGLEPVADSKGNTQANGGAA